MSDIISIVQGDRSKIYTIAIDDVDTLDSSWTGKVGVCETLGGTMLIDRAMPKSDDSTEFVGYLTPTETAGLDVGQYYFIMEITNTTVTPPVNKEVQYKIEITEQGIYGEES